MRGLINHTWSQPLFLCKAHSFPTSQGWAYFISGSLGDAWWLEWTVGMISVLVQGWFWQFTSMAHTSCFCLVSSRWMWNCSPGEQVCISYNCPANALTAWSILVVWLFHACQAPFALSELCLDVHPIWLHSCFSPPVNLNKFMDFCQEIHLWVS